MQVHEDRLATGARGGKSTKVVLYLSKSNNITL